MSQLKPGKYLELSEMAEMLKMTEDEFISLLHADGYLAGETQTSKARRYRVLYVERIAPRWRGGLRHETGFRVRVTPLGVKHFLYMYNRKEWKKAKKYYEQESD